MSKRHRPRGRGRGGEPARRAVYGMDLACGLCGKRLGDPKQVVALDLEVGAPELAHVSCGVRLHAYLRANGHELDWEVRDVRSLFGEEGQQ